MISNLYLHRDPDRHRFADSFAPERWLDGSAREEWSFNHFSRGPQGCPGAGLAVHLGAAMLGEVLRRRRVELRSTSLDPMRPLPAMLDYFGLRFATAPAV
jgi:cytochrome P450